MPRRIFCAVQIIGGRMTELDEFRAEKDDFFASHPQSPLTALQKQTFEGLRYFDEDPSLRFEVAVKILREWFMVFL
jgi:uncharacterized protein (DUF1684 family)